MVNSAINGMRPKSDNWSVEQLINLIKQNIYGYEIVKLFAIPYL